MLGPDWLGDPVAGQDVARVASDHRPVIADLAPPVRCRSAEPNGGQRRL